MSPLQWAIIVIAAGLPVIGWFYIIFNQLKSSKKILSLIFIVSLITAPLFLLAQIWLMKTYDTSISNLVSSLVGYGTSFLIINTIVFAFLEEMLKGQIVKIVDNKTLLINKIGDAMRFSLIAGLGFAFIENIFYLHNLINVVPTNELVAIYIYRSMFTMCGHLVYSGIYGHYYAMGKFSIVLNDARSVTGKISKIELIISNIFSIPLSEAFRQRIIYKGLLIATTLHTIQNLLLETEIKYNSIITAGFIVLCFFYLLYTLNKKSASLILTEDITTKKKTTIAKSNEEVVIELLGLWFNEKRYVDVMHVCERLLERDPDNKVVKLFKARAVDRMDETDIYKKILSKLFNKDDFDDTKKNKLSNYLKEKEELLKLKKRIKKIVESEGREYIEPDEKTVEKPKKKENKETYNIN